MVIFDEQLPIWIYAADDIWFKDYLTVSKENLHI